MASACDTESSSEKLPKKKERTEAGDDAPCTIEELENILTAPSGGMAMLPSMAYDEVLPGVYLGEGEAAQKLVLMRDLGVTHVLNAALGKSRFHVNTNHVMYRKRNIAFLGIEATDFMNFDLSPHFHQAADFIEEALKEGKVFVHCVQGVSRSATLVLAYLMLRRRLTLQDATRLVRARREIFPNPGFLQQLCDLQEKLKKSGHYADSQIESSTKGEKSEHDASSQLESSDSSAKGE